jgi:hypothetical protein
MSENEKWFKFRLVPKTREDWLRALVFPFRSYGVIAFVVCHIFWLIWSNGMGGFHSDLALACFYDAEDHVMVGYAVCVFALCVRGIADLFIGRWRSALLNISLAVFNGWLICSQSRAIA